MSTSTIAKGSSNQSNPEVVLWMGLVEGIVDEDIIKKAFADSGHPCLKVIIKNKERSARSGPFAFVEFKDVPSAKNALQLNGKLIPDFPDKSFRLNFANQNKNSGQGDANHPARANSMPHDAGRHSAQRTTAWQGKPTSATPTTQYVNRSHGHNQQQQQPPQRQQQQQPSQQQQQQPQQQASYWRGQPSSRHVGHQQSQRNQQNHDNTIFIGNLNPEVDDEVLNATLRSIYPTTMYAKVIRHPDGTSKGFGFVRFSSADDYNSALSLPADVKSKLGQELRISKAHPKPTYPQRRGLSNFPASNGPSFSNGTDGLTVPVSTSNDLSFQDVNSNSNIQNSSPSTISNNSNNSNNNVTRPSSVSASPAKPNIQPVQMPPQIFSGYAPYPPVYYYPTNFPGAEAYAGQFPQIFPSSHTLEGQPLYWQAPWPSAPVDMVPRGAVHPTHPHTVTGDTIHSPYGQAHGPAWTQYVSPYQTVVPNENSDISADQMPTPSFDGSRVQQHVAPAHHHV